MITPKVHDIDDLYFVELRMLDIRHNRRQAVANRYDEIFAESGREPANTYLNSMSLSELENDH